MPEGTAGTEGTAGNQTDRTDQKSQTYSAPFAFLWLIPFRYLSVLGVLPWRLIFPSIYGMLVKLESVQIFRDGNIPSPRFLERGCK